MNLPRTSLRIKVAKRFFSVFLLCVLIPFAGLVAIARWQVVSFFDAKSQRQLRAMAKTFGTDVVERLNLLRSSLQVVASLLSQGGSLPSETFVDVHVNNPGARWIALARFTAAGHHDQLLGRIEKPLEFSDAAKRHLASGKALVWVSPGTGEHGQTRIFMSLLVDPRRAKPDLIVGEINHGYLWGVGRSRILPSYITPCVTDLSGHPLSCSFPAESLPTGLMHKIHSAALGDFEWSDQDQNFFASYWTVPAKHDFNWPGCAVILRTSKEGVFASIAELDSTFLLWVTLCMGASILIAGYQIRSRLVPVEQLQEATRRFASQDFAFRAKVSSGDEFEELAASINAMARQLSQQFETLHTKAAIDRAVLSLLDSSKISETILTRIMNLLNCERATLTLCHDGKSLRERTFLVDRPSPAPDTITHVDGEESVPSDASHSASLEVRQSALKEIDEPDPIAVRAFAEGSIEASSGTDGGLDTAVTSYLQRHAFNAWLSMPLTAQSETLCVLTFYRKDHCPFSGEEMAVVNNFTGQAAIAMRNSRLFEQTKEQARELKQANQAKDDFLSIVSHELRTPLNVIMGYVRLLGDKILGEINADQEKAVATVNRHSTELLSMIDSIMEATLIQAGTAVAVTQPSDLSALLDNLKAACVIPPGKDIAVQWHYSTDIPLLITDERMLQRIIQNLVANAIKFTETGTVTVSARRSSDGNSLEIKVADTGVGMAAESLPKIFDLLNQIDNSKTREHDGLGLGLYIVKHLTNLLGGTIEVESIVGSGSLFTVMIPFVVAENGSAVHDHSGEPLPADGLARAL